MVLLPRIQYNAHLLLYQNLPLLEVREGEKHLHDGVEIAGIAQVGHTSVTRSIAGHQTLARFLDDAPLTNTHVHVYLQFRHGGVSLRGKGESTVSV